MKGVTELDLNFCPFSAYYIGFAEESVSFILFNLPHYLYSCDSLIHLNLGLCDINCPSNFNGFHALKTLRLLRFHLTSEILECIVSTCPLLEELNLRECFGLDSIKISGPNLVSFHYCGALFYGHSFGNISSLVDVILNSIHYQYTEPENDYIQILKDLAGVKVLTVCDGSLKIAISAKEKYYTWEDLPITFGNLQELQLLLTSINNKSLSYLYGFFANCVFPSLEKLFIQVPASEALFDFRLQNIAVEEPSNCIFHYLKSIKITSFKGNKNEMKLVKFLLKKAIVLEALILIVQKDSIVQRGFSHIPPVMFVHDQLLLLPKASSGARILLCKQSDDDNNLWPTHTKYYSQLT